MGWKWATLISVTTLIVLFGFKESGAIKCWVCRSDLDRGCADPFDNSTFHFTDCDRQSLPNIRGTPTMCRKIRQKVNGHWRYVRNCAWLSDPLKMQRLGDERYCLIRSGTWDIHIEYCECYSKDGCNSANKNIFNWKLATIMAGSFLLASSAWYGLL